jgi:hypothetical protein
MKHNLAKTMFVLTYIISTSAFEYTNLRKPLNINNQCSFGEYLDVDLSGLNKCRSCIDYSTSNKIAFWSNIINVIIILDTYALILCTSNRVKQKTFWFYSILVLTSSLFLINDIADCTKPISVLMAKNYTVLAWFMIIPFLYQLCAIACAHLDQTR